MKASGNNVTVDYAFAFTPSFSGAKNVYLAAYTPTTNTGFLQKGGWTVNFGPPTVVSVSPSSGTGLTQTFSATFSGPNTVSDLVSVRLLLSTGFNGAGSAMPGTSRKPTLSVW